MSNVNDGRGYDPPKGVDPATSVEGQAPVKGVPGGESSGNKWSDSEGPNPGRAPRS